jgi:hypothetical protein
MKSKNAILYYLLLCFCQQLTYKKGRIYNENTKLSNQEVKELLGTSPNFWLVIVQVKQRHLLRIPLGFGTGFIITDLVTAASQDKVYPSALTYIGLTSALSFHYNWSY